MKLEYIADKRDRAIASMVGVELGEKTIKLNNREIDIIKQAHEICDKADQLLRQAYDDQDMQNDYGWAEINLRNIINDVT